MLRELGVADERIKFESFTPAGRREAPASAPAQDGQADVPLTTPGPETAAESTARVAGASVTFARAGKTKPVSASETVLEAAEALGVDIAYDCRAGICGQCKTKLLSGRVAMDVQDALDPMDRANNLILSCQARCIDHVVLEA